MLKNFLPLSREVRTHWIYRDPDYFIVWCEMLFAARFFKEPKTDIYQNTIYTIQYGEFIFGRTGWGERLHVGEQKLRTLVKRLILENMIQLVEQKGRRFTIYKIVNYEKYNHPDNQPETYTESDFEGDANQPTNRTLTISQPSANHQLTTNKTIKKDKKVNKDKSIYAEFVTLTEDEYKKLVDEHGEELTKQMITILDNYKGANGKKYKSDYRAILNWVVKRTKEDKHGQNKPTTMAAAKVDYSAYD